jgi:GxxExxY protein
MDITKTYLKNLVYQVNGAAIEVHRALGPGLLESVYQKCLKQELIDRKIQFRSEIFVPVHYKGVDLDAELRCDFFIENILAVEIKAIEGILPVHEAQLLTYMKLLEVPMGLLTYVNELFRLLDD